MVGWDRVCRRGRACEGSIGPVVGLWEAGMDPVPTRIPARGANASKSIGTNLRHGSAPQTT